MRVQMSCSHSASLAVFFRDHVAPCLARLRVRLPDRGGDDVLLFSSAASRRHREMAVEQWDEVEIARRICRGTIVWVQGTSNFLSGAIGVSSVLFPH